MILMERVYGAEELNTEIHKMMSVEPSRNNRFRKASEIYAEKTHKMGTFSDQSDPRQ